MAGACCRKASTSPIPSTRFCPLLMTQVSSLLSASKPRSPFVTESTSFPFLTHFRRSRFLHSSLPHSSPPTKNQNTTKTTRTALGRPLRVGSVSLRCEQRWEFWRRRRRSADVESGPTESDRGVHLGTAGRRGGDGRRRRRRGRRGRRRLRLRATSTHQGGTQRQRQEQSAHLVPTAEPRHARAAIYECLSVPPPYEPVFSSLPTLRSSSGILSHLVLSDEFLLADMASFCPLAACASKQPKGTVRDARLYSCRAMFQGGNEAEGVRRRCEGAVAVS